jgi:hypothetical protein
MDSYLLPSGHPARKVLEIIFRRSSVIDNESAFQEAGFNTHIKKSRSLMRVASHPNLPGYIVKVFFIDERKLEREKSGGWRGFFGRCEAAKRIRVIIREGGIQHFQAPCKWLFYPPYHPSCGLDDQPVILIAEYQELVSPNENEQAWLNMVTEVHLDELYKIIAGAGGASYRPDNIPLTKCGKFAFIDTEYSHEEHDYDSITPYLTAKMNQYWQRLRKNTK